MAEVVKKCPDAVKVIVRAIAEAKNSDELEQSLMAFIQTFKSGLDDILGEKPHTVDSDMPRFYFTQGQVNIVNEMKTTLKDLIKQEREKPKDKKYGNT